MRSADRDSQDKNLVGSLDRFAQRAGFHDSVDSILTHVYPINAQNKLISMDYQNTTVQQYTVAIF